MYASQRIKKNVLNYEIQPLFIEANAQKEPIQHSKSAEWCSRMSNVLSCSGAFWTLCLGLFDPVLAPRRVLILSL